MERKVSVVVPVYNVEKYLSRCINSLINQTYNNIEIILVNDGSTDNSLKICEEYRDLDERIKLINQNNQGLSAARNMGIESATGQYICFVDSDDWVELDYVQFGLNVLNNSESQIAVVGSYDSYDDCDLFTQKGWINKDYVVYNTDAALRLLVQDVEIKSHAWDKMYDIALFNGIRFPVGKNFEDIFIMHLLFSKAQQIAVSKQPKYHYYIRSNSIARNYKTKNIINYFDAHFERLNFLNSKYPELCRMQHTSMMELVLSYYPKFKRSGADSGAVYKQQRRVFKNYLRKIEDLYGVGHEEFTEKKYFYMYRFYLLNKHIFSLVSPIAAQLIKKIKKSKYKRSKTKFV